MDEEAFQQYLRRGGRSPNAVKRCLRAVQDFDAYLATKYPPTNLADAGPAELTAYVAWIEQKPKQSAKTALWGLKYWFAFVEDEEMADLAGQLRAERIPRKPFPLQDFMGVNPEDIAALAAIGITKDDQLLAAAARPEQRQALTNQTGIPHEIILELAQLCDLARIPGMKGVRARLYHAAGIHDIPELAAWEPEPLRRMVTTYVVESGFPGIPPLPKEVASGVAKARKLSPAIYYD
jgi:hypothetical protein